MRAYLALTIIDLKLAFRDRSVVFFSYLFPLIFFFVFSGIMGSPREGGIANVVAMVLAIGILGNGLWGAGMRAVQEREQNILRRFKVTPISPAPILIASMLTGWLIYLPAVILIFSIAHFFHGMPVPGNWLSLLGLVTLSVFAFRSIGLIVASIVNGAQESMILIQLLYMPMMFLSGATVPIEYLPAWARIVGQFLPAAFLVKGLHSILLRGESLAGNAPVVGAMLITVVLSTFISVQIFRWEKDEKLRPAAKLWVLAVLAPFVAMGVYQAFIKEHDKRSNVLERELMRRDSFLIRNARIFTGPGPIVDSGTVLVKDGKINSIYVGTGSVPEELKVDTVQADGKTLLPGLIDVEVHLAFTGGLSKTAAPEAMSSPSAIERALAAYLYCGVTAVVNVENVPAAPPIESEGKLGAEVFANEGLGAVEYGSIADDITDAHLALLAKDGVFYSPGLSSSYTLSGTPAERLETLNRSLVQEVGPKEVIESIRWWIARISTVPPMPGIGMMFEQAVRNLARAYRAGAPLVMGSSAGNPQVPHGPSVQQEMLLWMKAGIPASVALRAATYQAARMLHTDHRIGSIAPGYEANLLLVDGNPLSDIAAMQQISLVVYKGERIRRNSLLGQN